MSQVDKAIQVSIVVPTFNERENIPELFERIHSALAGETAYEIIVVDDNSPDGTAGAVRCLAERYPEVRLLERPHKAGLASAVTEGFRAARGEYWVMMDADLSHRPEDLPGLLARLQEADIVVGSRYIKGGKTDGWPIHRKTMSRVASATGRRLLGLDVRDATSGVAAYRRQVVEPLLPQLDAKGFKLLLEILVRSRSAEVLEFPIVFVSRKRGHSKLAWSEVFAFLSLCRRLRRL